MNKNGSLVAPEILVVDDEIDIRELMAGILADEGYETRVASDSDGTLAAITNRRPHLVVLDVWLQGSRLDGIQVLDVLRREHPDLPVVIISGHGTIETAVAAIKKGAYDFIEKPFDDERLLGQVLAALEDHRQEYEEKLEKASLPILSARQRAVLDRVLEGKPNRQIAEELSISLKTVEFHRARIMQKLGVRTAAELFRRCLGAN